MQVYRAYIHLAGNEWGEDLMEAVAAEYFATHQQDPLVVVVVERGGWFVAYLRDLTIVANANPDAVLSEAAARFYAETDGAEVVRLETVRRREADDGGEDYGPDDIGLIPPGTETLP